MEHAEVERKADHVMPYYYYLNLTSRSTVDTVFFADTCCSYSLDPGDEARFNDGQDNQRPQKTVTIQTNKFVMWFYFVRGTGATIALSWCVFVYFNAIHSSIAIC